MFVHFGKGSIRFNPVAPERPAISTSKSSVIYESAASVNGEIELEIGAGRRRSAVSGYTSTSRTEDRSTLESEPSADPDRNERGVSAPLHEMRAKVNSGQSEKLRGLGQ